VINAHSRLCQALGRDFPVTAVFQHATAFELAAYLEANRAPEEDAAAARRHGARRRETLRRRGLHRRAGAGAGAGGPATEREEVQR
jgi:hypothetical protein